MLFVGHAFSLASSNLVTTGAFDAAQPYAGGFIGVGGCVRPHQLHLQLRLLIRLLLSLYRGACWGSGGIGAWHWGDGGAL